MTLPSHKPETVVVQGWFSQPDEVSSTSEEEFLDNELALWEWESESTVFDEEASLASEEEVLDDNNETVEMILPEQEEESTDSTYEMQPTALEIQGKLEATLPDAIKRSLGLPVTPAAKPTVIPLGQPRISYY